MYTCPVCGEIDETSVAWITDHRETRDTPEEGRNICVHCNSEVEEK